MGSDLTRRVMLKSSVSALGVMSLPVPAFAQATAGRAKAATC
jgi:hypothetical protein